MSISCTISPLDYSLTMSDLPNLPSLLCPVSEVHSTSDLRQTIYENREKVNRNMVTSLDTIKISMQHASEV